MPNLRMFFTSEYRLQVVPATMPDCQESFRDFWQSAIKQAAVRYLEQWHSWAMLLIYLKALGACAVLWHTKQVVSWIG